MKHVKAYKAVQSDLQRLARKVEAFRLPYGPFEYAARAQAFTNAQQLFHEIVREGRKYHADPQAKAVIEAARSAYHAAWEAAYPSGFWEDCRMLRAGNPIGLESAVRFLEADPMFFRSGYVKAWLIRRIKPPMLTPAFAKRLQNVVLSLIDRRDDRDFRAFCRLAHKVDSPDLRVELTRRLTHTEPNVRRRARWVLDALDAGKRKNPETANREMEARLWKH